MLFFRDQLLAQTQKQLQEQPKEQPNKQTASGGRQSATPLSELYTSTLASDSWSEVQEFYVHRDAMGIIVTATTALTKILRKFGPDHIIIEEASQIAKHTIVPVLAKFYHTATKATILESITQNR